ncbi:hypothetical protein B9T31_04655 [Acinetobacter sp. ANC 4558]|uniref:hypothetical protein n=1 Tax=Acinetobacter sp. ANC 4558 TaxID=1977876 RepID=UPI000A34BEB6|nr:hypothetical protein [Acinetobacter sp. ANC 4558]OTG86911.1 hypothetical protein B9T31_04655 [Acinetobacter sp. ANC 4558]
MLEIEKLKEIYPLIVTPSHDGKYFNNYLISILNLQNIAMKIGMPLQFYFMQGESLVTRARNNCVAAFLENQEWTHLFWIDADIGFSIESALRLLLSDYDIAAGVYPLKKEIWPTEGLPAQMKQEEFNTYYQKYTVNASGEDRVEINIGTDGFIEMGEAPTGFMLIKRAVFERMMVAYPELKYVPDSIGHKDKGYHFRFFDVMVHPISKRYLSEDYGFCYLWEKLGGRIYIDGKSDLSHQGSKLYHGNFAESLKVNLTNAIGAKEGLEMKISGLDYL